MEVPELAPTKAPAKLRILETADELFYEHGIRNVGVDRIISESSVTKATFYKHYRSKDRLIVDYITARHHKARQHLESLVAHASSPAAALREIVAETVAELSVPGFRGSAFINAAAEFPESGHQVRRIITAHREWYAYALEQLLRKMGHPVAGDAADELVLARDGALIGGYAGDPIAASAALDRTTSRVLAESAR